MAGDTCTAEWLENRPPKARRRWLKRLRKRGWRLCPSEDVLESPKRAAMGDANG